jgi:protein-S-isoprenylcysteine O-methyltransferase Ste14
MSQTSGLCVPRWSYLGSILFGLLLHFTWPLPLVQHPVGALVGVDVVLLAVGLFVTAVRTFRAASTPVPGNRPTATIVRTGPYRFSRNPIYVAFSALQVGIALCAESLWLLITLVPAVALMSFWVIPREERYLEAQFFFEYLSYKSSVRRWFWAARWRLSEDEIDRLRRRGLRQTSPRSRPERGGSMLSEVYAASLRLVGLHEDARNRITLARRRHDFPGMLLVRVIGQTSNFRPAAQ